MLHGECRKSEGRPQGQACPARLWKGPLRAIHGFFQIGRRASEMQYLVEAWAIGLRFQGFLLTPSELGDILISKSLIFNTFFTRMS